MKNGSFINSRKRMKVGDLLKVLKDLPKDADIQIDLDEGNGYGHVTGYFYDFGLYWSGIDECALELTVGDNHS